MCRISVRLALLLLAAAVPPVSAVDGELDTKFSSDGRRLVGFTNPPADSDEATAVLVLPDGRIVVAGQAIGGPGDSFAAIARLESDGDLDLTFDGDGKVGIDFGSVPGRAQVAELLLRPSDGHLIVVGSQDDEIGIAAFTELGALDPTFGSETTPGRVTSTLGEGITIQEVRAAALHLSGIVVGGTAELGATGTSAFVARFTAVGALDEDFGEGGVVFLEFDGEESWLGDLAVRFSKIVAVALVIQDESGDWDTGFARLLAFGTFDSSFDGPSGNGDGIFIASVVDLAADRDEFPTSLFVYPDGRILYGGALSEGAFTPTDGYFGRLLIDGAIDGSLPIEIVDYVDFVAGPGGMALQSDGRIAFSGHEVNDCRVDRYSANGEPDESFGDGGTALFRGASDTPASCRAVALAGGRLVAVGRSDDDFFVARLTSALIFADGFETDSTGQWSS